MNFAFQIQMMLVMGPAKAFSHCSLITEAAFSNRIPASQAKNFLICGGPVPFLNKFFASVTWYKTLLEGISEFSVMTIAKAHSLKWAMTQFAMTLRIMKLGMGRYTRQKLKVFNSVVVPDAVFVMDDFRLEQPSSKVVCHNEAMFGDVPMFMRIWVLGHPYPLVAQNKFSRHALWYGFTNSFPSKNGRFFHE